MCTNRDLIGGLLRDEYEFVGVVATGAQSIPFPARATQP